MENQQQETLEIASQIELAITCGFIGSAAQYQHLLLSAVSQLRRLHARNQELEGMLESVGAGGVSAQRITQQAHSTEREAFEKWAASDFSGINLARDGDDYSFVPAKEWWLAWQARAALDADHIEHPPEMVAAPAELNLDDYHCKGCGRIGEIEELNAQDKEKLRKIEGKPKTVAAPVEVVIDFERVGSAGPFAVVEGRVAIPVVTMLDLARMLKPTTDALAAAPVMEPEPAGWRYPAPDSDFHYYEERRGFPVECKHLNYEPLYTEQQVRDLLDKATCTKSQTAQEPFGYFKAEPFGWRDCAETDEGAIALYEAPQPQADARDAQRYRWLRAQPLESDMFCTTIWRKGTDGFGDDLRLEKLDAAIDAAIAAEKEHK